MNPITSKQILEKLRAYLSKRKDIKLAWVYGSFANETESFTSDIDVAVAADHELSPDERVTLALELGKIAHREIDLVDIKAEQGIIASQILTRGRLLVNKERDLYANLIKRMWLDRADFWPLRERIFKARRHKAFQNGPDE